jgi:hypothetical protein
MTKSTFNTWFQDSGAVLDKETGILTVYVKNTFAQQWLSNRLDDTIKRAALLQDAAIGHIDYVVGRPPPSDPIAQKIPQMSVWPQPDPDGPGPGRFKTELVQTDPLRAFVAPSVYAVRFWQPVLGEAFGLWLTLKSFGYEAQNLTGKWPAIALLADITAKGQRYKLLGRRAWGNPPHQRAGIKGWLQELSERRIVRTMTTGAGRKTAYTFQVLESLPLLTEIEVSYFSRRLQAEHRRWLTIHNVNHQEWQQASFSDLGYLAE